MIADLVPTGSSLVFDYPDQDAYSSETGDREQKQAAMANSAGETMQACYRYDEIEVVLSDHGFLIYEHLDPEDINEQFFRDYNLTNPTHTIQASEHVHFCLGVKKGGRN